MENYKSFEELNNLPLYKIYKVNDELYYKKEENNYIHIKQNNGISLYELNKSLVTQLEPMKKNEIKDKIFNLIENFTENNKYYMLYSQEINYFTIFKMGTKTNLKEELFLCLTELGKPCSIEMTDNNDAIEIWLQYKNTAIMAYFFDFTKAVIDC